MRKRKVKICLKHNFSIFKQHYTYFYALFYSYIFHKNTNNIIQTSLPKRRFEVFYLFIFFYKMVELYSKL